MIIITDHEFKITQSLYVDANGDIPFTPYLRKFIPNFVFETSFEISEDYHHKGYVLLKNLYNKKDYYMRLEELLKVLKFIENFDNKIIIKGIFTFQQKGLKQLIKFLTK